jgi:hypothetical protein
MIALVVERTSHTLVTRLPAIDACATRTHTTADAFATSIAATRSTNRSSPASASISSTPPFTTAPPTLAGTIDAGCPGASVREPKF